MKRLLLIIFLGLCAIQYGSIVHAVTHHPFNTAELERQVHRHINLERQRYGLAPLSSDKKLVMIARNHSRDMANQHFFSHINLQGEDSSERGRRQGWNKQKQIDSETFASGLSENIFMTHLYDKVETITRNGIPVKKIFYWQKQDQIVDSIVQGWMNSSGHRENILSPQYDQQGIGIAISGNELYVTEDMF
jgi:uncharacterized protein YkwD